MPHFFDLWGKMTAYPKLTFFQSCVKFQKMVPEILMKRAKRDILTYIHTDQPSHRISMSWFKMDNEHHLKDNHPPPRSHLINNFLVLFVIFTSVLTKCSVWIDCIVSVKFSGLNNTLKRYILQLIFNMYS